MPNIGFIGLGNMGAPMAANLVKSGDHVLGFDVVVAARQDCARLGVEIASSAKASVEAADIVIMNRVLCCYPDMPKLTAMASAHCREVMALSFPKDRRWTRAALKGANLLMRLTRRHFQVFVHRPERILAVAEQHGLMPGLNQPGGFWQVAELRKV